MEEWKDINGYYQASNLGRIKSIDRYINNRHKTKSFRKGRILAPCKGWGGYSVVHVSLYGVMKTKLVHRLVWEAFNGPIPEGMQINHINEDKSDNRLENLSLVTQRENVNWGTANTRRGGTRIKNNILGIPVEQYTVEGVYVRTWKSASEASRNGFDQSHISACCQGKQKTHKNFKWKYA